MSATTADTPRPARRLGSLRLMWPFVKPHRALALGWLLFLALSSGASLALPMAFRHIIDQGFGHSSLSVINGTFIALFGVALVLAVATAARYFCISLLSERALASLRKALYAHLIRLDVGFFERSRVGELISRLTADTEVEGRQGFVQKPAISLLSDRFQRYFRFSAVPPGVCAATCCPIWAPGADQSANGVSAAGSLGLSWASNSSIARRRASRRFCSSTSMCRACRSAANSAATRSTSARS